MQDKQNSITKMECEQENHDIPHNKVIRIGGKSEYKRGNKAKILEMWNDGNGKTRNEIIKELELPRGTVIKIIWQYNKSKKTWF